MDNGIDFMAEVWDEARVQQYIDDGIEESLNLDYKAAGALSKTDGKRKEITKDVSAMANSDGGIIVYGMTEQNQLPGNIDPVKRNEFSKEWLEHVIGNIRPKIDGLIIHPVPIGNSTTDVVYVVEIPKSHTAHQAQDKRYYKRFNFQSVMMDDYEIRDVMNRRQHPRIKLDLRVLRRMISEEYGIVTHELEVEMSNQGRVYAQYVVAMIYAPCDFIDEDGPKRNFPPVDLRRWPDNYCQFICENSVVERNGAVTYPPILPGTGRRYPRFKLPADFDTDKWENHALIWATFVDNAPINYGSIAISEIEIVELEA